MSKFGSTDISRGSTKVTSSVVTSCLSAINERISTIFPAKDSFIDHLSTISLINAFLSTISSDVDLMYWSISDFKWRQCNSVMQSMKIWYSHYQTGPMIILAFQNSWRHVPSRLCPWCAQSYDNYVRHASPP